MGVHYISVVNTVVPVSIGSYVSNLQSLTITCKCGVTAVHSSVFNQHPSHTSQVHYRIRCTTLSNVSDSLHKHAFGGNYSASEMYFLAPIYQQKLPGI